MQENVKVVPSFATNFTVYATPEVTLNVVTGNVMVHVDCTGRTYGGLCEGQFVPNEGLVILTP